MNRLAPVLGVVAVMTWCAPSRAQTAQGFAADRFDPSERGSEWFAADSLDLRGDVRPAIGIGLDWAYRPLVVYAADGAQKAAVLENQVVLHPGASLVLWDRARVGMDIPVAVVGSGSAATVNGVRYSPSNAASLGDVRLSADVRLFGKFDEPFTLAGGVAVYLPSGSQAAFTGDGTVRAEPRLLAAGRIGAYFVYGAHVGVDIRPLGGAFAGSALGSDVVFAAAAGVKGAHDRLVLGPEVYGSTVVGTADGPFARANTPLELLLGAHYRVAGDWRVAAGIGPGLTQGLGAPELRTVASLEWAPDFAPPRPDADHDGVWDGEDACPTIPGIATGDPRTNGCPPDRDGDGIADGEDACPTVPGARTTDPKTNGCPPDSDRDGVPDVEDACPTVPGVRTDDPRTNGCPPDRDGDGIADGDDACPTIPGVRTGDPRTNGCPPDRDGDGITDADDACPDQAGPRDSDPKKNGCPPAFLQGTQIKIRDPFKFRFNSIELDPAGDPILEAVLAFLQGHPELKRIRIEGHTDDVGGPAFNQHLSEGRAGSVRAWLVAHGVNASRLSSKGFGQTQPVDTNATDEGRRNNRRVEFHVDEGSK